jgi:hypothetical protein
MYDYINNVLVNYFNANLGYAEDEAISILRNDLENSAELAKGLRADLENAFGDESYSWKGALTEYDVLVMETEDEARSYMRRILWSPFFGM